MKPLTKEQKIFAEENHNLIYSFLAKHGLSIDDWYDIAAIGYIDAVARYNNRKSKFSTFAYICMARDIQNELRSHRTLKRNAIVVSLDDIVPGTESLRVGDFITTSDNQIEALSMQEVLRNETTDRQQKIIKLRCMGYNKCDIATQLGIAHSNVTRELQKIKDLVLDEEVCGV